MRRKRKDRPVEKAISIPTSIASRVDQQLNDPLTNRPPHGAWAKLVTALLAGWLRGEFVVTVKLKHAPRPFCIECLSDLDNSGLCQNPNCERYLHETNPPTEV